MTTTHPSPQATQLGKDEANSGLEVLSRPNPTANYDLRADGHPPAPAPLSDTGIPIQEASSQRHAMQRKPLKARYHREAPFLPHRAPSRGLPSICLR